jgi:outer membrane protein
MKNVISIIALSILMSAWAQPARAASLLEVYQQALQSDPRIFEAEARRLAALEAEPQARGVLFPQIGFDGSYTESETDGSGVQNTAVPDPNTGDLTIVPFPFQQLTEAETTQWQFTLRQTLFRWDQIVGLRRADKVVARAEADREAAQQDLIVRVTQAYFDVLGAEDRLAARLANRRAIARQLEQAKQRFEVGLIAITDVQESQARYDSAIADEIAAKRVLATAEQFLREITGEYVSDLQAPSEEMPLQEPAPNNQQEWVDQALGQNLALVSSRIDEQLARDEIALRRTGHYPTIDLVASTGNREVTSDQDTFNGLGPLPANSDFDSDSIGIQLNVPLFSGGAVSSRVKEAVYLHRASREVLHRITRETERQTVDAYLGVLAEMSRVSALSRAVESNQTALQATQAGYDVGTRTIVEVLNAQFQLYEAITNYYQSRYDYLLNVMRLKQAAGTLEVQDLERLEPFLEDRGTPEERASEEAAQSGGNSS